MTQLTFISSQKIFEESCPKGSVIDRLKNIVPIDHITSMLDKNLKRSPKYRKSKTGRHSFSSSILLSMVILQSHYNLSD